jgi:heme/copper-type cytochrome/quinol oxidase subunit 3
MQALTAGPAAAPQRQIIIGSAVASMAMIMLTGGMLAVWSEQRTNFVESDGNWLPDGVVIPEVAANVALIAFIAICTFAQWAVWAVRRNDRGHTAFALAATALTVIMVINAQAFIYSEMGLGIADGAYATMFYAVTGMYMLLLIVGVVFTAVTAFRSIGGRSDNNIVVAHAIYWYTMAAVSTAVWFVVYVTK